MWKNMLAGLIAVVIGICLRGVPSKPDVDSFSYQAMAEGRMQEVVRPYSNRVLHPLVVRWTGGSFELVSVVTLVLFFVALTKLLGVIGEFYEKDQSCNALYNEIVQSACLVCVPFFCSYIVEIYLSDLFVMMLTAWFFWFLHKERMGWCLLTLFLMQIARESTVVVAFAFLFVALIRLRWKLSICIVSVFICALAVVSFVSRESPGNIHSMGGFVYMGTKVIASALANLLGVTVWSDTYAQILPHYYPNPPMWQMNVPSWLPLGEMKTVGIYALDVLRPVEVFAIIASSFGILPVLLLRQVRFRLKVKKLKWVFDREIPFSVMVAFFVGCIFFLLAPVSGRSLSRLVGYAWPLFWFVLLYLTHGKLFERKILWVMHLMCMWWPVLLARLPLQREMVCLLGGIGTVVSLWMGAKCIFSYKNESGIRVLNT